MGAHYLCCAPGFSVNGSQWATTYIGGANIIGTNQSSWASCFTCGKAPGFCTQVPGSNLTNQFSQWQGALLDRVPIPAQERSCRHVVPSSSVVPSKTRAALCCWCICCR